MMLKTKRKHGMSHIEVILSFVMFVGFLIFLFAIFSPFNLGEKRSMYLNVIERGLMENTSVELEFFSVKLNTSVSGCFCFERDLGKIIAKDESKQVINAEKRGGQICVDDGIDFFYVYSCEDFEETGLNGSCKDLSEEDYILGFFRRYDVSSFLKLEELKNKSETDYQEVKRDLGLPATKDFSFNLKSTETAEDIILATQKKAGKGTSVFARNIPIQLVYKNGTLKYAILNIRVW